MGPMYCWKMKRLIKVLNQMNGSLNNVTLSTFVVIMIYVLAIIDENLGTYITPLHKEIRCGNNEKE
jgi:hypothetical protein